MYIRMHRFSSEYSNPWSLMKEIHDLVYYLQARENMKEIHELQEERLMIAQVKAKDQMEKSHTKAVKKALRRGNIVDEVETNNRLQYSKLVQEHNHKVPRDITLLVNIMTF